MADSALTEAERKLISEFNARGIRFLIVGASAAVLQADGVPVRVLPLDRIIASKRATGRSRDRAQLPALEEALAAAKSARTE